MLSNRPVGVTRGNEIHDGLMGDAWCFSHAEVSVNSTVVCIPGAKLGASVPANTSGHRAGKAGGHRSPRASGRGRLPQRISRG